MRKKLNIKKLLLFVIVLIVMIFGCYKWIKEVSVGQSVTGKLSIKGYSEEEIRIIKEKLNDDEIEKFLNIDYYENNVDFLKEKYFIYNNLEKYLSYKKENKKESISNIVSIINVHADEEWYELSFETNISLNEKMLVNKFYALKEEYVPSDLVKVSSRIAYDDVYASETILESFEELCYAAKNAGFTLVAALGYRSYQDQNEAYTDYKSFYGTREADDVVAHPGQSEHQTGLALEIKPYNKVIDDIEKNEEHIWLLKNAYKYGFILRYPKDKENITGFSYEPWHFRYVGKNISSLINREKITYDEYYSYYIEAKNE